MLLIAWIRKVCILMQIIRLLCAYIIECIKFFLHKHIYIVPLFVHAQYRIYQFPERSSAFLLHSLQSLLLHCRSLVQLYTNMHSIIKIVPYYFSVVYVLVFLVSIPCVGKGEEKKKTFGSIFY